MDRQNEGETGRIISLKMLHHVIICYTVYEAMFVQKSLRSCMDGEEKNCTDWTGVSV